MTRKVPAEISIRATRRRVERWALVLLSVVGACESLAAACPAVTVANPQNIAGTFPQQFELTEFEGLAGCKLTFADNPDIDALNDAIGMGQPDTLPPTADRIPREPLIVAPYHEIGTYGGALRGISSATESGTADLMSVRHVNFARFADDLVTVVPNVAKSWSWNDDHTELTFVLRKGHRWSDGAPFTSADVVFWYTNMIMDPQIIAKPKERFLVDGKPWSVQALDEVTVRFTLPAPKPGLLRQFAVDYAQPFQPRHFFGRFHPAINAQADELAKAAGFATGYDVIDFYYGGSDWKDVPSPYLKDPARIAGLPAPVAPTLESHVLTRDTDERRRYVANPFFHQSRHAG